MKKYAKLTVLALVATFLFSFAACKDDDDATTTASAKSIPQRQLQKLTPLKDC